MSEKAEEKTSDNTGDETKKKTWWRRRIVPYWEKHGTGFILSIIIALTVLLYLSPRIIILLEAGHWGIFFDRFQGLDMEWKDGAPGLHVIAPWNKIIIYETRIKRQDETVKVLSNDGLMIEVEVTTRYRVIQDELALLHREIGEDYVERVIRPSVISAVREVVGKYRPEELYSSHREVMQEDIFRIVREKTSDKHVSFDDIVIRSIRLPKLVNYAIESKLRQQHLYQEYEFRLKREEQEASRKAVEAEGIKTFQDIVAANLTPNYLIWKGIQATLALADSQNAKVVVMGGGGGGGNMGGLGLPIILGNWGSVDPAAPPSTRIIEGEAPRVLDTNAVLRQLKQDGRSESEPLPYYEIDDKALPVPPMPEDLAGASAESSVPDTDLPSTFQAPEEDKGEGAPN